MSRKYLSGYTSKENAYLVEDYPWGFRLRTEIRYWVETKKGFGQRFCYQTRNPKNGVWCAPKKGTYSAIIVMYLDENEHVQNIGLSQYRSLDTIEEFKNTYGAYLDEVQKVILNEVLIIAEKVSKIKFSSTMREFTPI